MRTVDGKIGIFQRYSLRKEDSLYKSPTNCFVKFPNRKSNLQCFRDYILNHSKNIIDLIEVGDLIHYKLKNLNHYSYGIVHKTIDARTLEETLRIGIYKLESVEILSLITKEQIASIEYRLEV